MDIVTVKGLPMFLRRPKINMMFKKMFSKEKVKWYWIRNISIIPKTNTKEVIIEFDGEIDARRVENLLNGYIFSWDNRQYLWTAKYSSNKSEDLYADNQERMLMGKHENLKSREFKTGSRKRNHSPSPSYERESAQIDMEINLIRKKRQLLEEERLLLIEQKKLEMVKAFGTNVLKEFSTLEKSLEMFDDQEHSPIKQESELNQKEKKKRQNLYKGPKKDVDHLPLFYMPCRNILREMSKLLSQYNQFEIPHFKKSVRISLRNRLANALKDKEFMNTKEIHVLYRTLYPKSTDKEFVEQLIKDIKDGKFESLPEEIAQDYDPEKCSDFILEKEVDNEIVNDNSQAIEGGKEKQDIKETSETENNEINNTVLKINVDNEAKSADDKTDVQNNFDNGDSKQQTDLKIIPPETEEFNLLNNGTKTTENSLKDKKELTQALKDFTSDFNNAAFEDWIENGEETEN